MIISFIEVLLKESEIMDQNTIYIGICWYSKICLFQKKKWWYQRNSGVCHVIHIFFETSFGKGIIVPSFIIVGYVKQILGPPPRS